MAEYPDFKFGAYANNKVMSDKAVRNGKALKVKVCTGTAPVHLVEGGASNVNKPILVKDFSEAKKYLGYSDNWADYTLCQDMYVHLVKKGIGPLVFINVFDPTTHKKPTGGTASLTPENGRITIVNAEDVYLDSIVVKTQAETPVTKVKGTDYTASYNYDKKVVDIVELSSGSLGSSALTVTWDKADPSAVTDSVVNGSSDGYGHNTGLHVVKDVYPKTGCIPARLAATGFSSHPAVHTVMAEVSSNISKHWNAYMFVDMPLLDGNTPITLATAPAWKEANGYNKDNENVYFPLVKGTDGKIYNISVLAAANFEELLVQNGGIPYMSASNTPCPIIADLYFGEDAAGGVYDDEVINRCLCSNGINSAAYISGQWVIWGMFAGSYSVPTATKFNVNDVSLMMLFYVTNDFQHRRMIDTSKPIPMNTLKAIVAEEQARLDALLGINALSYAKVWFEATQEDKSDLYAGDFKIKFKITHTPLSKSLTADASLTDDGFEMYFEGLDAA